MTGHRHILITGTSRGLGRCLAEHYVELGDTVVGCARSESAVSHPNYHHFRVDVSSEVEARKLFFDLRKLLSRLDVLVNNAGVASLNAFAVTPGGSVRKTMDINFGGTFWCSREAVRLLRKSAFPRIVNMTTVAVPLRLEGEAAYAASKGAVEVLTRIMARELGVFGITCNAVGPSPVETDLIRGVGKKKIADLLARQAIHRMAEPADVINLIDFFLKPESGMITGQVVYLGGIS